MAKRPDPLPSLDALQQRLNAARGHEKAQQSASGGMSRSIGMGLRISVELVAGVVVGVVFGYLLDRGLGTSPWLLLAGFALGCAASARNLKRAVERLDKEEESGTTPGA